MMRATSRHHLGPARTFPGRYLARLASDGGPQPVEAFERQWTLGDVLSTLVASGLVLEEVREHATPSILAAIRRRAA
jgi:hypothetical protein